MRQHPKPARSFESLENRSMLAGNVTAAVVSGNLTVTGDASGNMVYLTQTNSGGWKILGVNTKINGSNKEFVTAPVTGNIDIDLGGKKDWLNIHDGTIPGHLSAVMGDGNDQAAIWDLTIGTYLHFQGDTGNDRLLVDKVVVTDSTFGNTSSIDMGEGKDKATINHFTDQDLQIALGAGKDQLTMKNSQLLGGPSPSLSIDAGADQDSVSLSKTQTSQLTVEMGPGDKDGLSVASVTADGGDFLDTGGTKGSISGNSNRITSQTISSHFTHRSGDLRVNK